jgi:hypothetical protein
MQGRTADELKILARVWALWGFWTRLLPWVQLPRARVRVSSIYDAEPRRVCQAPVSGDRRPVERTVCAPLEDAAKSSHGLLGGFGAIFNFPIVGKFLKVTGNLGFCFAPSCVAICSIVKPCPPWQASDGLRTYPGGAIDPLPSQQSQSENGLQMSPQELQFNKAVLSAVKRAKADGVPLTHVAGFLKEIAKSLAMLWGASRTACSRGSDKRLSATILPA